VIWSLWLCRNVKVFTNKNCSLLQVLYRCTGILRSWSPLQRLENRGLFTEVCTRLEATAGIVFSHMGGHIIFGLDLHLLFRRSTPHFVLYFILLFFVCYFKLQNGCVHLSYAEAMWTTFELAMNVALPFVLHSFVC
jgi:hypothetical protein